MADPTEDDPSEDDDLITQLEQLGVPVELVTEAEGSADVDVIFASAQHMRSGPLPGAEELAAYEEVLPGLANRIVEIAENEQTHRHALNERVLEVEGRELDRLVRGQWLGVLVATLCSAVATVALLLGYPYVAGVVMGTTIVSLTAVFVVGRLAPDRTAD
jgi:uncharacterized membrane protein